MFTLDVGEKNRLQNYVSLKIDRTPKTHVSMLIDVSVGNYI